MATKSGSSVDRVTKFNSFLDEMDMLKHYMSEKNHREDASAKSRKKTLKQSKTHILDNGILYYCGSGKQREVILDKDRIIRIIASCHLDESGTHRGVNNTLHIVSELYWWNRMGDDVQAFVKSCKICEVSDLPKNRLKSEPILTSVQAVIKKLIRENSSAVLPGAKPEPGKKQEKQLDLSSTAEQENQECSSDEDEDRLIMDQSPFSTDAGTSTEPDVCPSVSTMTMETNDSEMPESPLPSIGRREPTLSKTSSCQTDYASPAKRRRRHRSNSPPMTPHQQLSYSPRVALGRKVANRHQMTTRQVRSNHPQMSTDQRLSYSPRVILGRKVATATRLQTMKGQPVFNSPPISAGQDTSYSPPAFVGQQISYSPKASVGQQVSTRLQLTKCHPGSNSPRMSSDQQMSYSPQVILCRKMTKDQFTSSHSQVSTGQYMSSSPKTSAGPQVSFRPQMTNGQPGPNSPRRAIFGHAPYSPQAAAGHQLSTRPQMTPSQPGYNSPRMTPVQPGYNSPQKTIDLNASYSPRTPAGHQFSTRPQMTPGQPEYNSPQMTPGQTGYNSPQMTPSQTGYNSPQRTPGQPEYNSPQMSIDGQASYSPRAAAGRRVLTPRQFTRDPDHQEECFYSGEMSPHPSIHPQFTDSEQIIDFPQTAVDQQFTSRPRASLAQQESTFSQSRSFQQPSTSMAASPLRPSASSRARSRLSKIPSGQVLLQPVHILKGKKMVPKIKVQAPGKRIIFLDNLLLPEELFDDSSKKKKSTADSAAQTQMTGSLDPLPLAKNRSLRFICDQCGQSFTDGSNLKKHIQLVHFRGMKKFVCEVCEKAFGDEAYFKKHVLRHTACNKFLCSKCGTSFAKALELRQHNKTLCDEAIMLD